MTTTMLSKTTSRTMSSHLTFALKLLNYLLLYRREFVLLCVLGQKVVRPPGFVQPVSRRRAQRLGEAREVDGATVCCCTNNHAISAR